MSERPKVGDRVVVRYEGVLVEDDNSTMPFRVRADGGNDECEHWALAPWVTVTPPAPPRPRVGDRVRYRYYTGSTRPDHDALALRTGTIVEDDGTDIPFNIREDATGYRHWAALEDVEVIAPPQPERSPTALEERLRVLEEGLAVVVRRVQLAQDAGCLQDNIDPRLRKLEEQMASLRSLFHNAGNV